MADEAALEVIRAALREAPVRAPGHFDRVYKEECLFSFDTPLSPGGLYVNLATWQVIHSLLKHSLLYVFGLTASSFPFNTFSMMPRLHQPIMVFQVIHATINFILCRDSARSTSPWIRAAAEAASTSTRSGIRHASS